MYVIVLLSLALAISVQGAPTDPEFRCIDECVKKFVNVLERPQVKQTVVCKEYKDGKTCLAGCRGGDRFLEGMARMAPTSFKTIETMCLNPSETATVDPRALALIQEEDEEMNDMEKCISGCDGHINDLSQMSDPSLDEICDKWSDYKICVKGCPNGDEIFSMAGQAVPQSMATLNQYCSSADEGSDALRLTRSSDETSAVDVPHPSLQKFDCIDECFSAFEETLAIGGEDVKSQCLSYEETKLCVLKCEDGKLFLKKLSKIAPVSTRTMEEQCKDPDSGATLSPTDMRALNGEEDEANQMSECVEECEIHIMGLRDPSGKKSLDSICTMWGNYKTCVNGCPDGAEIMDLVRQMIPKMFNTINSICPSDDVPQLKLTKADQ